MWVTRQFGTRWHTACTCGHTLFSLDCPEGAPSTPIDFEVWLLQRCCYRLETIFACFCPTPRKQFGSGSMEDPLRHAVGMRTAQDQYKMQMWNSFPSLFQNTIFHGEQAWYSREGDLSTNLVDCGILLGLLWDDRLNHWRHWNLGIWWLWSPEHSARTRRFWSCAKTARWQRRWAMPRNWKMKETTCWSWQGADGAVFEVFADGFWSVDCNERWLEKLYIGWQETENRPKVFWETYRSFQNLLKHADKWMAMGIHGPWARLYATIQEANPQRWLRAQWGGVQWDSVARL